MEYVPDQQVRKGLATDFAASLSRRILSCSTDLQVIGQLLGQIKNSSGPVPPEVLSYLDRVTQELRHLSYQTLSLSQTLDPPTKLFSLAPLNVELLVEEMVKRFQGPGPEARLAIRSLASCPWVWWSQTEQLRMILDSLANLLLRYTRSGNRVIITLKEYHGQPERRNGGYLVVSLAGTDSLLRTEHTAQLLTRPGQDALCEQVHNGLSLYLARQLIERHEGQLELETDSGGSLTLWFSLPLVE